MKMEESDNAQGLIRQTDASLSNEHVFHNPFKIQRKDTHQSAHQIYHGQVQIQLKGPLLQTQLEPGNAQPFWPQLFLPYMLPTEICLSP